jgi:hypothetical protein
MDSVLSWTSMEASKGMEPWTIVHQRTLISFDSTLKKPKPLAIQSILRRSVYMDLCMIWRMTIAPLLPISWSLWFMLSFRVLTHEPTKLLSYDIDILLPTY